MRDRGLPVPGVPVDGVVGVLAQVGLVSVDELIRMTLGTCGSDLTGCVNSNRFVPILSYNQEVWK